MSQITYPIAEIIFFIAVLFAPSDVSEIQLRGMSGQEFNFTATTQGWIDSKRQSTWQREGNTVVRDHKSVDLSPHLQDLDPQALRTKGKTVVGPLTVFQRKYGLELVYHAAPSEPERRIEVHYQLAEGARSALEQ